jgi:hypothetical protein
MVRFSVSVWAGIVGDIVVGPYLLPDRLTAQQYRNFLETVLPGLLICLYSLFNEIWNNFGGRFIKYQKDIHLTKENC